MNSVDIGTYSTYLLTLIPVQTADVEGCDGGSPGGGPGEAGSTFLKVGLTFFLIHVATLEL